jgi:hypothetical protein
MVDLIGFDELHAGQYLKISGKLRRGRLFLAVEISCEPPTDEARLEGPIQSVDLHNQSLRIFSQDIRLQEGTDINDLEQRRVDLSALKPGQMVKLKGAFSRSKGFVPKKIKMKETLDFNIEELQGVVDAIDCEKKTVEVNGVKILVTDKTIIQSA